MTGLDITIAMLGVALTIAASRAYVAWRRHCRDEKLMAVRLELSKQETRRFELLARSACARPMTREA